MSKFEPELFCDDKGNMVIIFPSFYTFFDRFATDPTRCEHNKYVSKYRNVKYSLCKEFHKGKYCVTSAGKFKANGGTYSIMLDEASSVQIPSRRESYGRHTKHSIKAFDPYYAVRFDDYNDILSEPNLEMASKYKKYIEPFNGKIKL